MDWHYQVTTPEGYHHAINAGVGAGGGNGGLPVGAALDVNGDAAIDVNGDYGVTTV